MRKKQRLLTAVLIIAATSTTSLFAQKQKSMADFFIRYTPTTPLVDSNNTWGADVVTPRDTTIGLEDGKKKLDWCYWDGKIVKDDKGKYHMYASRWSQKFHHGVGWTKDSKGVHAVSDNLFGKYVDTGIAWKDWKGGKGHNVVGLRLKDGRYAMITSEITNGEVFVSDSPEGPFKFYGEIKLDYNGFYPGWGRYNELDHGAVKGGGVGKMANVTIFERHDGRYMLISRHCVPMISESDDILGPYKMLGDRAWWGVKDMPQYLNEDPTAWYSDGMYHIAVNHYKKDHTYHLTSEDGIHNWKVRGIAYDDENHIFDYSDGTQNRWYTVQRPTAYVEDGEVKAFNFSVIDVHKGQDGADDIHGSKVVVVPFDGKAFGQHIRSVVEAENEIYDATPAPSPWKFGDIGDITQDINCGYDEQLNTIRMKVAGNKIEGSSDKLPFLYQKMSGDISISTLIMSQDLTKENISAGLMLRSSLEEGAKTYSATISNDEGLTIKTRDKADSNLAQILVNKDIKAPYWLRLEKRGEQIKCYVSTSNLMNWDMVLESEVELGDEFYAGLTATNDSNSMISLARFKDADLHEWGNPNPEKIGIVSHTFPDTIPTNGKIDFEIEFESNQSLDFYVDLENVDTGKRYKALMVPSKYTYKGVLKATYETEEPLEPNSQYWFTIKATPMHFHQSEAIQTSFKKVFTTNK